MLIHSPNWLGDVVMALPAFRAWRDRHADEPVHILAKRRVAAIWGFVRDVDSVIVLEEGRDGARAAREAIRAAKCDEAILLPQSFRSAWIVWRAGVGNIRGTAGQFRSFMVSDTVSLDGLEEAHQQIEYARLLGVEDAELPPPCAAIDVSRLPFPDGAGDVSKSLVILPGAARGDSKRWPSANFAEVAVKALDSGVVGRLVVCGTPGEAAECEAVADGVAKRFPDAVLDRKSTRLNSSHD